MNDHRSLMEVADLLSEPANRVRYIVAKYRIKHCRLVGNCRMYDGTAVATIKQGLFNMRIQRSNW